jgi:hypothetical protein
MFSVYDGGSAAKYNDPTTTSIWRTNTFTSFEQALKYTKDWLGDYDTLPDNWDGKAYDYSGYGDTIEIVEE